MNDEQVQQLDADRLDELKTELSRHFGKFTRWKVLCVERGAETPVEQMLLAEEVLKAPSTGTNAEWLTYRLRLQGSRSFDVDEMPTRSDAASGKDEA